MQPISHNLLQAWIRLCLLCLIASFAANQSSANTTDASLPADWFPPAGWAIDEWTDPGDWQRVDVTAHGLKPNDPEQDATPILTQIIESSSAYRILYFPAGEYYFKSDLTISQNGIRIVGEGIEQTKFFQEDCRFTFQPKSLDDAVIALSTPPKRGDSTIHSVDAAQVSVGDYILPLAQFPWGGNRESYNTRMSNQGRGQIVIVEGIEGESIQVSEPMGLDYTPWPDQRIQVLNILKDVGMESLYIQKLVEDEKDTIVFEHCANAYVKGIRSYYTHLKTIKTLNCYRVFIEGNNINQGWSKPEGGHAYGIQLNSNTTRAYVLNNKLEQLRHGIILQQGANHCVVAYNHTKSNILLHGNYANNNLFEGNFADAGINFDAVHGSNGPYNFVFRNVSMHERKGIGVFRGEPVLVVGNVADNFLKIRDEDLTGASRINGQIEWGALPEDTVLPASLYYQQAPDFLAESPWPVFGPGAGDDWGAMHTIPAASRETEVVPTVPLL